MDNLREIQFSAITIMQENAANENKPDIQTQGLGDKIPRYHGRVITSGNIFWLQGNTVLTQTWNNQDAKFATFALGLGINVGCGRGLAVTRIWAQGRRIFNLLTDTVTAISNKDKPVADYGDYTSSGCYGGQSSIKNWNMAFQFFPGTLTQPRCKIIAEGDREGQGDTLDFTPRFPGLCYIVFTNFPLAPYNNDLSSLDLKVELVKTNLCTCADAVISRMTVPPSPTLAYKLHAFQCAIRDAGILDVLDTLAVAIGGETEQAMLLDWVRPGKSYNAVGAATLSAAYGFESTAGGYFNTDYNPGFEAVNASRNSYTVFAWCTKLASYSGGSTNFQLWNRSGSDTLMLRSYDTDYRLYAKANDATIDAVAGDGTLSTGELFGVRRNSSTYAEIMKGATVVKTSTTASSAFAGTGDSLNVRVMETAGQIDVSGGIGIFGMGGYLDDTKWAALRAAIVELVS